MKSDNFITHFLNTKLSMASLVLFNKPFQVLSQFSASDQKLTLKDYINMPDIYPAGRLDFDSEGLLLLTDNGQLQHQIAHPKHKQPKTYWVQVEGIISEQAIEKLKSGVLLKDGMTKPAKAKKIAPPAIPDRNPPIRQRNNIPTSWIELVISEGKNRQVRRMTASVGFPTLRLYRYKIGNWSTDGLVPGEYRITQIHLPSVSKAKKTPLKLRKK